MTNTLTTRDSSPPAMIHRNLPIAEASVEIRDTDSGGKRFLGHSAVFDTPTLFGKIPWGWYEVMDRGCFTETLKDAGASRGVNQAFLINHDSYYVVARESAGTLRHSEDSTGLLVDADLDTALSYVNDLIANLRNKNVTQMSFGFWFKDYEWETVTKTTDDGGSFEMDVLHHKEVELLESSSVTFPQYQETDAGLRAAAELLAGSKDDTLIHRHTAHHRGLADILGVTPTDRRDAQRVLVPTPAVTWFAAQAAMSGLR